MWGWLFGRKSAQCSANSGLFMGYRCTLDRGHEGEHEAVVSIREEDTLRGRREVSREIIHWWGR